MAAVVLKEEEETQPAALNNGASGERNKRRFTYAALIGAIIAGVPYFWILTDEWTGTVKPLRSISFFANFYDLQAEAIIHGHLWVPTGKLGIEGFIHDGRTYTYFGLLPSLFRIPILLAIPSLDGRLTAPSMFVAWLFTALFSSLLIWRVRVLLRGGAILGWGETVSVGVLVATILGGSVLLFLAAAPWVYNEDIAWSIPITIATLFVFIGILDRPTKHRVVAAGALILAGVLDRPTPALACIVGAVLIAGWFRFGRGAVEHRRWAPAMAAIAVVPFLVSVLINWLKFGTLLNGLPLSHQVWAQLNAHRRVFLAATGEKGYSFHLIPTDVWAYFQPFGLRLQPTFPFFALPVQPPHVIGGYIIDVLYPTPSVPASMPLLFLLSCCALVVCFRRHASRGAALMRIPLIVAAGATAVDYLLGYIAPRYLGDFLPFLTLGGAIGLIAAWGWLERRRPAARRTALLAVVVLGILSMAINIALAFAPTTEWLPAQATHYIKTVKAISDVTGHPFDKQIKRGRTLPYWAPANDVYIIGDCAGLYLSSGDHFKSDPILQAEHHTWVPVEQGSGLETKLRVTFNAPLRLGTSFPLISTGKDAISIRASGGGSVRFVLHDPLYPIIGAKFVPKIGHPYVVRVETNPILHLAVVQVGSILTALSGVMSGSHLGAAVEVHSPATPAGQQPVVTVARFHTKEPNMSLCRSLLNDR
jgi:hypothetical protein